MKYNLVKTGACSIILGPGHYGKYIDEKANKLFKVTKIVPRHNEFKNLGKIREIENYENYYSIPDEEMFVIKPDDDFYNELRRLTQYDNMTIFHGNLSGFYINFAGNYELHDTIADMETRYDFSFWKSYKKILNFTEFMLNALDYLHQKKICHLDIKPENIMVDRIKNKFKIIDFGFSSLEPFDDYISDTKGTPGYFPKFIEGDTITPWLPKIHANDMVQDENGHIPMYNNRQLVYKVDSYCLGRVLYSLKYIYDVNKTYMCFNLEKKYGILLDKIIKCLIENDVNKRYTVAECLETFFKI